MPYSTLADAKNETVREQDALDVAARIVQRLAPPPDPEPADYPAKAAAAERLLFNWLTSTAGGLLTSGGVSGLSAGFARLEAVKAIVADSMGAYYTGGATDTAYVEDFTL